MILSQSQLCYSYNLRKCVWENAANHRKWTTSSRISISVCTFRNDSLSLFFPPPPHSVTAPSSPLSPPVSPTVLVPELPPAGKNGECTICFDQEVDTVIYTCGHMCLCNDCGLKLKRQINACCPICRRPIKDVIKTYRPWSPLLASPPPTHTHTCNQVLCLPLTDASVSRSQARLVLPPPPTGDLPNWDIIVPIL